MPPQAGRVQAGPGKASASGSVPQARQSSTRPLSSASAISGRSNGARPRCSASDHSRIAVPGASRPARPARWSAAARLMRRVASRVRPVAASKRGVRRQPPSTTMRTPGTVSEVSAMLVASTTRRPFGGAQRAILLRRGQVTVQRENQGRRSPAGRFRFGGFCPCRAGRRGCRRSWAVANASRIAAAVAAGRSRGAAMSRLACSHGHGEHAAGALDRRLAFIRAESLAPSTVADMASRLSSGRNWRCRSRQSARARSRGRGRARAPRPG